MTDLISQLRMAAEYNGASEGYGKGAIEDTLAAESALRAQMEGLKRALNEIVDLDWHNAEIGLLQCKSIARAALAQAKEGSAGDPAEPMDDSDRLKRCPFCASEAEVAQNSADNGYYVECLSCKTSSAKVFPCGDDPLPVLHERWNRRATEQAKEGT